MDHRVMKPAQSLKDHVNIQLNHEYNLKTNVIFLSAATEVGATGGLCVWKQNCSIFEQAAVTSSFLSSPYRASEMLKKKT